MFHLLLTCANNSPNRRLNGDLTHLYDTTEIVDVLFCLLMRRHGSSKCRHTTIWDIVHIVISPIVNMKWIRLYLKILNKFSPLRQHFLIDKILQNLPAHAVFIIYLYGFRRLMNIPISDIMEKRLGNRILQLSYATFMMPNVDNHYMALCGK